jgi:ABC-type glycerol-3-phosphate transport system substrate-binding protein
LKNKKFVLTICLFAILSLLLSSCGEKAPAGGVGGSGDDGGSVNASSEESGNAKYTEDGKRIITIGTWYDRYYVSKHTDITDDPGMAEEVTAQMRLDRMREIEEKYDVVLQYANLTFDGVRESIDTSIPSGKPDVDIYEVDLQFGVPAVLEGYSTTLEEIGLDDAAIGSQKAIETLQLPGQQGVSLFAPISNGSGRAYPLAFNLDMLTAAGLENPQDLYDRGEWTWDKWREYLKVLTKDTDGDGAADVYGYGGYWPNLLSNLLMANGTGIALGKTEELSSPATAEVFAFINTIYNEDKTARPWDNENWEINNQLYAQGVTAFWIGADWIFNSQGGADVGFEIGVVPWPTGPSGNQETDFQSLPSGNWYFIPKGADDPKLIYDVMYDWINWFDEDLSIGLSDQWSRDMYMSERNYDYARMMGERRGFDLWNYLGADFNVTELLAGNVTPDELIADSKASFQETLDKYYK